MNREGFDKLIVQLSVASTGSLLLGMESTPVIISRCFRILPQKATGCHHQSIADCQLRKAFLEKNKDGQEDALTIAQFLLLKKEAWQREPSPLTLPNSKICPEEGRDSSTR